jgi:hypothetical protein
MGVSTTPPLPAHAIPPSHSRKKSLYTMLWVQVLLAVGAWRSAILTSKEQVGFRVHRSLHWWAHCQSFPRFQWREWL